MTHPSTCNRSTAMVSRGHPKPTTRWPEPPGSALERVPAISATRHVAVGLPTMAEYVYTLRNVRKAHGDKVVLDNVTLSFLHGAKIGVVGPNGTGKSTL